MPEAHPAALPRGRDAAPDAEGTDRLIALPGEAGRVHPGLVRRPALLRRLTETPPPALAVIVAPPGYGKSALLADWAVHDERPFFWMRRVTGAGEAGGVAWPALLTQLSARKTERCVIVLDDAHRLEPATLREVVDAALRVLGDGSTMALASRAEPALPLGRLRAHRALAEIRAGALAMEPAQAAPLLRDAGLQVAAEDVRALLRRTEGWPVALYLAALSARATVPAQRPAFRGDDHLMSEYLHDEVLPGFGDDLGPVARRSSILDELTGPVCDAVLMRRGSALAIAALADRTQLLTPLDSARTRYRWHPLLRESLAAELRRVEPELESQLHARASAWYGAHGDVDRAIEHACSASDERRAGELLWPRIPAYTATARGHAVQGWLGRFRPDQIARDAGLAASAAYCALAVGDVTDAEEWALHAQAVLEREPQQAGGLSIVAGLLLVEAVAARAGVDAMRRAAERAWALEPVDSALRPSCRAIAGVAAYLAADLHAAVDLLEEAAALAGHRAPAVTALCLAQRATVAIHVKDWDLAADLDARAREAVSGAMLSGGPVNALVLAVSAAVSAHAGRADEAKRHLRAGVDLLARIGDPVAWYAAEVGILLAIASLWVADVVAARTLLAQASRLARRTRGAVVFERWFDAAWSHMDTLAEATLVGPSALTIAELRILRFLPSHLSFREIAGQLGVSANTVKTQAHAVYRKLGAASRSEAVAHAQTAGLLGH